MVRPFIAFHKTLESALSVYESPVNMLFEYKGIQLLPEQSDAYVQQTDHITGIELEDWEVYAVTLCGKRTDITANFEVFSNFTDSRGMPQIVWQLKNLPDLGYNFVYLEINQLFGETFYTSPFQVTDNKSQFTARFTYKEKNSDWYQSIQLRTWFRQYLNRDELTTYFEISTNKTVTHAYKKSTIEKWHTELFNNNFMVLFRDLLHERITYVNRQRFNIYEAFEIPELVGNENYNEQQYLLSVDKNDILTENPNEMGLIDEIEMIKAQLMPLTGGGAIWIWERPASEIPPGWEEVTELAGKTIFGRLDLDPDFGILGNTGGAKTATLTEANLAPHTHGGVPLAVTPLSSPDAGELSCNFDLNSSGDTASSGSATPFSILNPHRIVNFIRWTVV